MKCPKCGYENIDPNSLFCNKCGAPLNNDSDNQIQNIETNQSNYYQGDSDTQNVQNLIQNTPHKTSTVFKVIVSLFLGFMLFLFLGVSCLSSDSDSSSSEDEENTTSISSTTTKKATNSKASKETKATTKKKAVTTKKKTKADIQKEIAAYKSKCVAVNYKDLARNPDKYKGKKIVVKIQIAQIMDKGILTKGGYRGYEDYDISSGDTYLKKEWFVDYEIPENESKILEDDVIKFYGEFTGTEEMERALTDTKEYIPQLKAKYYELIKG